MLHLLYLLLATARSSLRPQRELALENLALRQHLAILKRKTKRPKLTKADRAFWVAVPPQNPVDCTIVDVCAFGVELACPDGRRAASSLHTQPERESPSHTVSGGGVTFANLAG
jgi:hypothetical protein